MATKEHVRYFGGTGANQAFYAARLSKKPPILVGSVGSDGNDYLSFLKKNNIDISNIRSIKDHLTAMGSVITDTNNNQIWMYSKAAMYFDKDIDLSAIVSSAKNPFVIIAPTEELAMEKYLRVCIDNEVPFAFDPAFYVPQLKKDVLAEGVKQATIVFGNDYEIQFISRRLEQDIRNNIKKGNMVITTYGEKGSSITTSDDSINIESIPAKFVDPTGAGDAYRSGFICAYLEGKPLKEAGKQAAKTASIAIEAKGTINEAFTRN